MEPFWRAVIWLAGAIVFGFAMFGCAHWERCNPQPNTVDGAEGTWAVYSWCQK